MSTPRTLPSLDGLRAVSIVLVLIAHLSRPGAWYRYLQSLGPLGVSVFFVISGFLITHLLLKESLATGRINLKRFYTRRFFRIFPPYYAYLAILGALWASNVVYLHFECYLSAVSYVSDYYGYKHYMDWSLIHTWSLSIEEKFYLFWPACIVLFNRKRAEIIAIGLFVVSPVLRVVTYAVVPSFRPHMAYLFHTRIDTLMCGCLIALFYDDPIFGRFTGRMFRPAILVAAVLFLFVGSPVCVALFRGFYGVPLGPTLESVCIGLLLLYVVRKPQSWPGRVLNTRGIRHIGVVSYSLYLWQQPWMIQFSPPWNLLLALTCAELSFTCIERPSQRLRDALEQRSKCVVPEVSVA
jgi:peptidoglycan/LPS O-acetylase OafA/YrhL